MREEYKPQPGKRYDEWSLDLDDEATKSVFRFMKFCDIKNVDVLRSLDQYELSEALTYYVNLKQPTLRDYYFRSEMEHIVDVLIQHYYPVEVKWLKYTTEDNEWIVKKRKKARKWGNKIFSAY